MKTFTRLLVALVLCGNAPDTLRGQSTQAYQWKPVAIGGGGFFTGIEFAPSQKDRIYLRSDVAGPWRRDAVGAPWTACNAERYQTDPFISAPCAGLAVHPTDADIAYANFTMDYSKRDDLYKTTDAGRHWKRVKEVSATAFSKNAGRQFGPCVVVDIKNPDVVYFRTKTDGLYRSINAGEAAPVFDKVLPQQTGEVDFYSRSVVVDPAESHQGRSKFVYVTVAGLGVFRSENGGDSFSLMPGSPTNVRWMRQGSKGQLYITGNTGVHRCADPRKAPGTWKDITPKTGTNVSPAGALGVHPDFPPTEKSRGTWGLACDPGNTDRIVINGLSAVSTPVAGKPDKIKPQWALWRSTDAGDNWVATTHKLGESVTGWVKARFATKFLLDASGMAIDPFTTHRAYLFGAFQIYRTEGIWGGPDQSTEIVWELDNRYAEDVIPLTLCAPPAEATGATAPLYSGVSDVRGFRHADLDQPPSNWVMGRETKTLNDHTHSYVTSYDYAEKNPLVLMACKDWRGSISNVLRSRDGGITWDLMPRPVADRSSMGGDIALSLHGDSVVFGPANGQIVHHSTDGGQTWKPSKVAGTDTPFVVSGAIDAYDWDETVKADRETDGLFYANSTWKTPGFFVSMDGGATWSQKGKITGDTFIKGRGGYDSVTAPVTIGTCPGKAGEVWLGLNFLGIWRSSDFGETFTQIQEFGKSTDRPQLVTFGKAAPGSSHGTVYVHGKGTQGWGFYRSTDLGANWTKLTGFDALGTRVLAADRQVYGRLYIGEGASGILYGVPEDP